MKNKKIYLVIAIVLIGLLISGGSYAYWSWISNENKTVVFNTSKNIQEYIVYDEGESKFVGDFKVGNSYLDGVHTTVSIHKTSEAANIILYASINMRIKEIGANLANSEGLKWVITSGDSNSGGEVLASGDFYGSKSNDEFIILDNIEVTETLTSYTVWIWLDEGYATSEMTGEKIDTAIWAQVNQYPENNFEVTNLSNNYQVINATVVNSNNNIVSYAVTDSNIEPVKNKIDKVVASPLVSRSNDSELTMLADSTNWIDIPVEDQKKVYVFKYVVNSTGTYYIWFKDSSGKVISKEITVSDISTDKPVCTWSNPGSSAIKDGESTTISLTCIDTSSKIINSDISISDINVLSNSIVVSDNIVKERIENGYKYTFTVSTGSDIGIGTITIPTNLITNEFNLGNDEVISSSIAYSVIYNITYKDVGGSEFSGVHESGYPETYNSGVETILDLPSKNGYTFNGYYLNSDGTGNKIPSISNTQTGDITIYAKWIDNVLPYGVANLSLTDGAFTLTLSNYGDDGSGLTGTYGFALISSGNCENVTYEYQTELSKTYSENLNNNVVYYGCIKLEDNEGNIIYAKSSGIEYAYINGTQTYTTSGESTFTVPETGTYKLEVWGAQGGSNGSTYLGGYGGYSVGTIMLKKGISLFINVATQGESYSQKSDSFGGYNGGGLGGGTTSSSSQGGSGGGGATHIATISGELYTLSPSTDIDKILIVAGGGGGGGTVYGGHGGGYIGVNGGYDSSYPSYHATGGTQSIGGIDNAEGTTRATFGQGGNKFTYAGGNGGGGGYYGGGGSSRAHSGGGGGSGYIGNSLLTNKYMYCYNCTTSDVASTKTYTTTNVSSIPTSNYAKLGDGAARITWSIINDQSTIILTYDNQGGSGCYSKSVTSGSIYGELCIPVREGYSFDGWYAESSGGTEITASTTVSETVDHTIYAHWTKNTEPVITFSNNGTSGYVSGAISSKINVSKGSADLDLNSFKYAYSKDRNASPDTIFYREYEYTLENATGLYYLIATACDINGNCTTEVSNPFYVDNSIPSGSLILNTGKSSINVEVNAIDQDSGINTYEYLATLNSSCPTTGYVSSSNSSYTVYLSESGNYTVCVRITDKAGNNVIISDNIELERKTTLPYGRANLFLTDGVFTLSLSDYGDEGGDLLNTFGYALISSRSCETATYEYQTELFKTYSDSYVNGDTYYGCIKLEDNDGNITYIKSSGIEYLHRFGTQTYTTSGEYEFTVPETGIYKLEVWGAQGGGNTTDRGGYGGYSVGDIILNKYDILYIIVGGQGLFQSSPSASIVSGGYNGGGTGYGYTDKYVGSGGGATHISTVSGELKSLSPTTDIDKILIVAGGGGSGVYQSSSANGSGGDGGGHIGNSGNKQADSSVVGSGGSQISGGTGVANGSFGQGGNDVSNGPGGGGGYYGGGSGKWAAGAGGGSGYIGNSLLTDKYMYCYNCTTSDEVGTKTYTTTNVSDTPTSDYAKSGDGAARITWDFVNNQSTITLTYDNQGGSGCYSKSVTSGSTYGELCTPVKNGYSFDGWYTEVSGGTEITSSTTVSATTDHTIYAHWTESNNPVITFSNNGNSGYVSGSISSVITVSRGSNNLDMTTFKYIYSTNIDDTPNIEFKNENSYILENATGIYYLIAQACDVNGNCTTEISNPFYVDNENPVVTMSLTSKNFLSLTADVDASDSHSGIKEYGYLIQNDSTCPTTGYTTTENSTYTFNVSLGGTYYVCVRITDKVGNSTIISDSIELVDIDYEIISDSYSCANTQVGSSYLFTYTGNCQIINDSNGNYRIKFLSSGNFTTTVSLNVDIFLVGGGGGGENHMGNYTGAGGGGGYTRTYRNEVISPGTYAINVGAGGSCGSSGGTSYFGSSSMYYAAGGAYGSGTGGSGGSGGGGHGYVYRDGYTGVFSYGSAGNGGSDGGNGSKGEDYIVSGWVVVASGYSGGAGQGTTTREFGESSGTLYSQGGNGASVVANSGNGGDYWCNPGSSGIVIIRNKR